ncbi:MAG: C25 family cysteine peptidase [Bacteroidales bacterium]
MMKKIIVLFAILAIYTGLNAQVGHLPLNGKKGCDALKFTSKSTKNYELKISLNELSWKSQKSKTGDAYTELLFDKCSSEGEIGTPQLPAYKKLILLPYGAIATATVRSYSQSEYSFKDLGIDAPIIPVQPSVRKDQDSSSIPFQKSKDIYSKKSYLQNSIVKLEILGNMRSYTIARVVVTPVDYNPAMESIKVYNDIDIDINISGGTKSVEELSSIGSPYFDIIDRSTLNTTESVYDDHPDLTKYPVKMLIISDRMFESSLAPFIAWKTQKGFNVVTAYTDIIGTSTSQIKTYIQGQYNAATETDPAPTFLIFVGDVAQVPSSAVGSQSGKQTDLYYASVDGDIFPEMYYGRLSATTTAQLDNIINKILYYEKYEFADPSYLNQVTLIAGADGTYNPAIAQPTIKYGTANYFNATNGFSTVNEFGVSSDPNNSIESSGYTGCYDASKISVGLINYTAHCSETSWADPALSITMVNLFNNQAQYPVAIANCCLSGDFGTSECIGEAWLRAQDKGAVTYIGSSPSSYWKEDMYWAVGAFPMSGINNGYVPTFEESTTGAYDASFAGDYRTAGALVFAGNLAVTEANSLSYPTDVTPTYYWEAYNILGDPSLVPYFTSASANVVTHESTVPVGVSSLKVNALERSYVSITKDSKIIGTSYFDQTGEKDITIQEVQEPCDLVITVTRPQTIPYIDTIEAVVASGSYIVLNSASINDSEGNDDGDIDFGEVVTVNLNVKNVGTVASSNTRVLLTNHDGFATLTSGDSVFIGTIQGRAEGNIVTINDAFTFKISSDVPDNSEEKFTLTFRSDEGEWTSILSLIINAPQINANTDLIIDDSVIGNNNQEANPGESLYGAITITNTGNSIVSDLMASISVPDSLRDIVVLNYEPFDDLVVNLGDSYDLKFRINISPDIYEDKLIPINVVISSPSNSYVSVRTDVNLNIVSDSTIKMKNQSISTCYAIFTDSGGDNNNYSNGESYVTTITSPDDLSKLKVSFNEFSVESNYDYLYVYDGESTSDAQMSGSPFTGSSLPADIYSSGKSLTFKFTSDSDVTKPGWNATISCTKPAQVPVCVTNPYPANNATEVLPSKLTWDASSDAQFYDVYIGYDSGNLALLSRVVEPSVFIGLDRGKEYFWRVIPGNYLGTCTDDCGVWSFSTATSVGDVLMTTDNIVVDSTWFYDSGGAISNYGDYEDYTLTFIPKITKTKLKIAFDQFEVETDASCGYDYLKIYDGPTTNSTLVGTYCGTTLPSSYTSTSTDGELTFVFHSDQNTTGLGWKAKISTVSSVSFYNLTVVVNCNGSPVRGATIQIDNLFGISDENGKAEFQIPSGVFSYVVNALGYNPISSTESNNGSDQTLNITLDKLYSSTITVLDDATSLPIPEAKIIVDGVSYFTNDLGTAVISSKLGAFSVAIEKDNYSSITSDINIVGDNGSFSFTLRKNWYALGVLVQDISGNPLSSAKVEVNGSNVLTGSDGKITIDLPCGIQKFVVTKDKYLPSEQWFDVGEVSQISIVLDTLYSEMGDISFGVFTNSGADIIPLEDAKISILFGDLVYRQLLSDAEGQAIISLPDASYRYVVEKAGYNSTGYFDFNINNTDYNFKDTLAGIPYTITFNVHIGDGSPVVGASVDLGDYGSLTTNSDGNVVFSGIKYTKGLTYIVQKDGFYDYNGTVDIDADKTVSVKLVSTSIEESVAESPKVYPNPATDNVYIESLKPIRLVQIISIMGSVVCEFQSSDVNKVELSTRRLSQGSYIVLIIYANGRLAHAKLVKI